MIAKSSIRIAAFLGVLLLPLTSGCGAALPNKESAAPGSATSGCEPAARQAAQMATIDGIAAEERSTAQAVRRWVLQEQTSQPGGPIHPVPALEQLKDDAVVHFCAYRGSAFVTPRPPGAPEPDTAVFFVLPNDEVVLYVVGPRANMTGPVSP